MAAGELHQYLSYLLASANRSMSSGIARSIAAEGVTEPHWRILQVLSDEQGRSMGELADLVLMNHPGLTKNIDKLVSRGLVHRSADSTDSRRVLVYITDTGIETVRRLNKQIDAHHRAIDEALGPKNAQRLKRLLDAFIRETEGQ